MAIIHLFTCLIHISCLHTGILVLKRHVLLVYKVRATYKAHLLLLHPLHLLLNAKSIVENGLSHIWTHAHTKLVRTIIAYITYILNRHELLRIRLHLYLHLWLLYSLKHHFILNRLKCRLCLVNDNVLRNLHEVLSVDPHYLLLRMHLLLLEIILLGLWLKLWLLHHLDHLGLLLLHLIEHHCLLRLILELIVLDHLLLPDHPSRVHYRLDHLLRLLRKRKLLWVIHNMLLLVKRLLLLVKS